jgi:hypothetical protein
MDLTIIGLVSVIALLFVGVCALGYACYNLIKKIEVYEEWLEHFRSEVDVVYAKLKTVDEKNLFEKDDDVGFIFSEIVRITKEFDDKIK